MFKKKLSIIVLSAATLGSASVYAACNSDFYVGGEVQYNSFKYGNELNTLTLSNTNPISKKNVAGGGFFIGARFHENFGVEAGISGSGTVKGNWNERGTFGGIAKSSVGDVSLKSGNLYADFLGYLPVGCDIDLIGSLGLGILTSKATTNESGTSRSTFVFTTFTQTTHETHSKIGMRAGAGVQYKFNENLGARLMGRYQKGNDFVKNITQVGLGLFYQF